MRARISRLHYPAAFYTALLNNQPMGFYHPATLVKDAQRRGVRFAPIDVQVSDWDCTVTADGAIRLGLRYVTGLREDIGKSIAQAALSSRLSALGTPQAALSSQLSALGTPNAAPSTPHAAPSTPHAALSTPHAALSTPHAALSTPHAALSTPHAALSTPHAALSTPHAALSTPHAAPSTPHAAPSTPHAALSTPHEAPGTPHEAPGTPHATLSPPHESLSTQHEGPSTGHRTEDEARGTARGTRNEEPGTRCPKCGCDDPSMIEQNDGCFCNVCSHHWSDRPVLPRRFASIDDLVRRVGLRRDEVTMLAEIGALNAFGLDRRSALWQVERAIRPAGELFEIDGDADQSDEGTGSGRSSAFAEASADRRRLGGGGLDRPAAWSTPIAEDDVPSPLDPMTPSERLIADYAGTSLTIGPTR